MKIRLLAVLLVTAAALALPLEMNYQGKITDPGGVAVDGPVDITFRIYDVSTGGTALWSESHSGVDLNNGLFDVILGGSSPLDLAFDTQYWIEIEVEGEPLTPREPLTGVPYAFRAGLADSVVGGGGGSDSDWSFGTGTIYNTSDNVGIGTTSPSAKLEVSSDGITAIRAENPAGMAGLFIGEGTAVQAQADYTVTNSTAIFATGGRGASVWAEAGWNGSKAVYGYSGFGDSWGVYGEAQYGVYGKSYYGTGSQYGVAGEGRWGVKGIANSFESPRYAIYGDGSSTDGGVTWAGYFDGDGYFAGDLGIGIESPAAQLHTDGSVRFEGAGTPGDGKVLTSDASGNATWQALSAGGQWTEDAANDRIYNNNATAETDRVYVEDDGDLQINDGELRVMRTEPGGPTTTLTTLFSGGNGQYGNMFDIITLSDPVVITGFDLNLDFTDERTIRIYYRLGTSVGYETNESAWTLHGEYDVTGAGVGSPTHIDFSSILIPADTTYGFYVIVTSSGYNPIEYTNGSPYTYTDDTLSIRTNCGNPSTLFSTPTSDRRWNGTVYYSTDAPYFVPTTLVDGFVELPELESSPTDPASDFGRLYVRDDSKIYFLDDGGTEYDLTSGGGGSDADWTIGGADGEIYNASDDVGIGTAGGDVDNSAKLEVTSTDKGVLFPRMDTDQRDGISYPAVGLLIYNTDTDCFNYYIEDEWVSLCGESGSSNKRIYRYTDGSPYRFTNTTGSYMTVTVKCWGGGGGGNGNDERDQGFGGGGGFVQAKVSLADGEHLDIEPAQGGEPGAGGGASVVVHSVDDLILVAGGGGGAGACGGSPGPLSSHGGAAGGFTGESGTDQSTSGTYTFTVLGGGGGTQTAGGSGGTAWTDRPGVSMCDGDDGGSMLGGTMYSGSSCASDYPGGNRDDAGGGCSNGCGGSGGSGYYGGGAGGSVYTYRGAGGGGGSSYYSGWPDTREPHFTIGGEGQIAGNMHDPDYQFSAGLGGYPGSSGKDGLVVLIIE